MANFFGSLLAKFNALVDWFTPPNAAEDRELAKHMRMYIITHILGPFLGNTVPASLFIFNPNAGLEVVVLAIAITSFWLGPFLLRAYPRAYYILAVASIQNLIFSVLWSCYFYGGITSPTLPWVLVIPLHVIFYVGSAPVLRLVMLGMFTANLAVFYSLSMIYGLPAHDVPFSSLQGLGLVSTAAASLYTAMMAFFYAKVAASHGELEREMQEHMATAIQLRHATEEAERAGAAKADFLAKMSHELRTPLNAVIGYSQILLEDFEDEGDAETIADLHRIHGAGRHLLKLVNEVLDLIKIDAGKMELYRETIDLKAILEDILAELEPQAKESRVKVTIDLADDLSGIFTDRQRLRDAIYELAENAIKFSSDGSVLITGAREADGFGAGRDALVLQVSDTGIGIPASHLPNLFEQFSVINDASSSKYGGAGLGLALTRRICDLLGGDISVSSVDKEGSCFTIRIPFQAPALTQIGRDEDEDGEVHLLALVEAEAAAMRLKNVVGSQLAATKDRMKVVAHG